MLFSIFLSGRNSPIGGCTHASPRSTFWMGPVGKFLAQSWRSAHNEQGHPTTNNQPKGRMNAAVSCCKVLPIIGLVGFVIIALVEHILTRYTFYILLRQLVAFLALFHEGAKT